jgi:hypothetical protein
VDAGEYLERGISISCARAMAADSNQRIVFIMKENTHGPVATNIALWFTMLSPLIGLITAYLGARLFNPLSG